MTDSYVIKRKRNIHICSLFCWLILLFFNNVYTNLPAYRKRRQLPYLQSGSARPLISYGGSLRLCAAPTDIRFCSLFLLRGADSTGEFEQIRLVNPQHHRLKVDSKCEITPAKLQNFYETESHNAKKVAKRDENSSF